MSLPLILQQVFNGLSLGAIYALVALGYTLIYGVLGMINFAHSEIFMLGGMAGWLALSLTPGLGGAPALGWVFLAAMTVSGVAGMVLYRTAYAPLKKSSPLTPLLSAVGASLVMQNIVFLIHDNPLAFPALFPVHTWGGGLLQLTSLQVFVFIAAVLLMAGLWFFVQKSFLGRAIRAVAQDAEAAALMGIPVRRIITLTFLIGGALGGAAGVLNGLYYGSVKYNMGFLPGIKAFTAAVLGGVGSIPGAMLGGFLLGLLESLGSGFLPEPEWKDLLAFAVLILVLIFRPSGLFGPRDVEKI